MDKLLIFLLYFHLALAAIKIKELKVPQSVESGTVEDVILDCDFDAQDEVGIEVKWFLNGDIDQIYQWIPETNRPGQAVGKLKDNIDVNYKISNDRNTMHRALHIVNISPDMSGNYTCKVSGYTSEDVVTKRMIIYEPAQSGLNLGISEEESVIVCSASGMYPRPNMTIFIANDNGTEIFSREDQEMVDFDDETRLYNVSAILYYDAENVSNPFEYICELNIPGTTYILRELRTHYLAYVEIETQIEEDYVNLLNYSNYTESPFNETQEYADNSTSVEEDFIYLFNRTNTTETNVTEKEYTDFETQIEEDVAYVTNITDSKENTEMEDSASISNSPTLHLIVPILILMILSSIIKS